MARARTFSSIQLERQNKNANKDPDCAPIGTYSEDSDLPPRPKTRADCINGIRPCPFVRCRYHLYLDVTPNNSIKVNFPNVNVWEMSETCTLDVADSGGVGLREVAKIMNISSERTRQVEVAVIKKIKRNSSLRALFWTTIGED